MLHFKQSPHRLCLLSLIHLFVSPLLPSSSLSLSSSRAAVWYLSLADGTWLSARAHTRTHTLPACFISFFDSHAGLKRPQLSSRCNLWQPEMDSSNGAAEDASHTGRRGKKTFNLDMPWLSVCLCRFGHTRTAPVCRLNVFWDMFVCDMSHECVEMRLFGLKLIVC